jgi:hypothetical protein
MWDSKQIETYNYALFNESSFQVCFDKNRVKADVTFFDNKICTESMHANVMSKEFDETKMKSDIDCRIQQICDSMLTKEYVLDAIEK